MPDQIHMNKPVIATWAAVLLAIAALVAAIGIWQAKYAGELKYSRPETYLTAAEKAMNSGDFDTAMRYWEEGQKRAPDNPYAYKVLGDIHYNSKQWAKAEEAYRKALELKSRSTGVRTNLLWCLVELGKYSQAVQYGKECIANGDETPEFYRRTAEACFRGKRFSDSVPLYENALKGFPNDLYLMEHLRQACQVIGDYGRAKRLEKEIAQLQGTMTIQRKE